MIVVGVVIDIEVVIVFIFLCINWVIEYVNCKLKVGYESVVFM